MWYSHLGRISVTKPRIKLLDDNTQPVDSAPFQAEPKPREFEKLKIEKKQKDHILEIAQTEWVASTVIAPKKNGSF